MKGQKGYIHVIDMRRNSGASLSALASGAARQLRRWHQLYRQRQQLAALSDATLKDIGVSRADIEVESQRPFWDDPLKH
ncbi:MULTISPECIES: DUF1127 domain-containing protein [Pseudomonas]|jgi:uncharacterized protein YjiS (DUF1127 family)